MKLHKQLESFLSNVCPDIRKDNSYLLKIINNLPILDSLLLLSRMDAILYANRMGMIPNEQKTLLNLVFGDKKDIVEKVMEDRNCDVFFHLQQIYYCMGLILRYSQDGNSLPQQILSRRLGKVLLFVNELCDDPTEWPLSVSTNPPLLMLSQLSDDINAKRAGNLWRMGQFATSTGLNFSNEFLRTHWIYCSEKGQKFSSIFREVTEIEWKNFVSIVFAIHSKWEKNSSVFIPTDVVLNIEELFLSLNISQEQISKTLNFLSANLTDLKKLHQTQIEQFNNEPFNFEFLKDKPLLEFEPGKYILLSMPYLITKATKGVIAFIRNVIKTDAIRTRQVNDAIGDGYEEYVTHTLNCIYNPPHYSKGKKLAKRAYHQKSNNIQVSDGVIDYGDRAIFIEVKAMIMEKRYKISKNPEDIESALKSFFTHKGAIQLEKRIQQFRSGEIRISEIEPSRIKRYYPVLITGIDEIPQFPILSMYYQTLLKKHNILQDINIAPLTILGIREFEQIMEITRTGGNFIKLIDLKSFSKETYNMSFLNFLVLHYMKEPKFILPHILELMLSQFSETILLSLKKQ